MSGTETAEQVWTEEEVQGFWQTVGAFSDGLPAGQREALNAILAGAAQAVEGGAGESEEAAAFRQRLVAFRDGLPPRQRDEFTSLVAVGAAEVARGAGDEVQGYWIPAFAAVMWGSGVIVGAAATQAGVFDAIPSPDALAQALKEKQKGKPPA